MYIKGGRQNSTTVNLFSPRPTKTVPFVSLLCLMLYDFTRQGRASEWERVKPNRWTSICGGTNCCVPQCSHNSLKNPNLSFYKIPKDGPKEFIEIIYMLKVFILTMIGGKEQWYQS